MFKIIKIIFLVMLAIMFIGSCNNKVNEYMREHQAVVVAITIIFALAGIISFWHIIWVIGV